MPKGIIVFGPAGSGKTTLGKMLVKELNNPYFDLDDYIWRWDTEIPYTKMYTRKEKIQRFMNDISNDDYFVMAGSMSSFHEHFDPFFELGIFLYVKPNIRLSRVHQRKLEEFGNRILEGGDMYAEHQDFLKQCRNY